MTLPMECSTCSPKTKPRPVETEAWILGTGISSLASAVYLIKHAGVPPSNVHILDSHGSIGHIGHQSDYSAGGYDQFAGCLPVPMGATLEELLASIRSAEFSDWRALSGTQIADVDRALTTRKSGPSYLVQKNHAFHHISTASLTLGIKHRFSLLKLMLKTEKRLGKSQIQEVLPCSFFGSAFWATWSAHFGFQPWHSAIEMKRGLWQYLSDFQTLAVPSCLDITGQYQYESIFLPIYFFLQSLGVDFRFNTKIRHIVTTIDCCHQTVSRLDTTQDGLDIEQKIQSHDIVLATLGSTVSGCAIGSDHYPPTVHSIHPTEQLDENWSLWLELGSRDMRFGNPYNFCTHRSQSTLLSFTITTEDLAFFRYVSTQACSPSTAGTFILLQESRWKINLCAPSQDVVRDQPPNVRLLWGYALVPGSEGNFVNKPMLNCSGAEILSELLFHLKYPAKQLAQHTVVIPRVMPRMSSHLICRAPHDRPQVIPPKTSNIGLVGQFVELPYHSCADLSYGILAAKLAVFALMELPMPCVKVKSRPWTAWRVILLR